MSNEFIQKLVRNERTQANITGMAVDTQSRFLLNPMDTQLVAMPKVDIPEHKNIFMGAIEKIAREMESLKISNEITQLEVDLQKMDLDLDERWRERENTDKYRDAYKEYTEDRMKVFREKQKIINNHRYLTPEQKQETLRRLRLSLDKGSSMENEKRGKVFSADQLGHSNSIIQQLAEITMNMGANKEEEAQANYKLIMEQYTNMARLTGELPENNLYKAINEITKIEATRLGKDVMKKLGEGELTFDKINGLREYTKNLQNNELYEALTDEFINKLGVKGNDRERTREYIKSSFTDRIETLSNSINKNLNALEKQKKTENRKRHREQQKLKAKIENSYSKARNNRDYGAFEYAQTLQGIKGKTFEQRVAGEIEGLESHNAILSDVFKYTGKTIREINLKNEYIKNYVPAEDVRDILIDASEEVKNGINLEKAIFEASLNKAQGNVDIAELIVNSVMAEGGHTKRVDMEIEARKGDLQAQMKVNLLGIIDNEIAYTPKDLFEAKKNETLIENLTSRNKHATKIVDKLKEKGMAENQAKKITAQISAGILAKSLARNGVKIEFAEELHGYGSSELNKLNSKLLEQISNNDLLIESIAEANEGRRKRKATEIKGIKTSFID